MTPIVEVSPALNLIVAVAWGVCAGTIMGMHWRRRPVERGMYLSCALLAFTAALTALTWPVAAGCFVGALVYTWLGVSGFVEQLLEVDDAD